MRPAETAEPARVLIGFHGTNAAAATFDVETGAFFSNQRSISARYGRHVEAFRLNLANPAQWSPALVSDFQDWLINQREEGFDDSVHEVFRRMQVRAGCDPEVGGEGMEGYVTTLLRQPARRITFSDSDPIFHLLRQHLIEAGHDGLIRPHEISDNRRDGSLELIPFHAHQFAPLLAPDTPPAFVQTKLRNEHQEPLVVYRGEQSGDDFPVFDRRKTRERGFFFTPEREIAAGYAKDGEPRAFVLAADRVLDLTKDTIANRQWVEKWAESFDDWTDRRSGEPIDAFSVLEGGGMFDYEGDWAGERWKDLQASAEAAGFDAVILPDLDNETGVFPSVVVFRPEQVWELKPPTPALEHDDLGRHLLRPDSKLRAPAVTLEPPSPSLLTTPVEMLTP